MKHKNPIHQAIYDSVVKPALGKKIDSVTGVISRVDYYRHTADVFWVDNRSGGQNFTPNLPLPEEGPGVYSQSIKNGDKVELSFLYGNVKHAYISSIHQKDKDTSYYDSKFSGSIPRGISFL